MHSTTVCIDDTTRVIYYDSYIINNKRSYIMHNIHTLVLLIHILRARRSLAMDNVVFHLVLSSTS